jgi:hypothetical protein
LILIFGLILTLLLFLLFILFLKIPEHPTRLFPPREDDSFYLASIFPVTLSHLVSSAGGNAEGKGGQRLSKW